MATLTAEPSPQAGAELEYLGHQPVVIGDGGAPAGGRSRGFGEFLFGHDDIINLPRVLRGRFDVLAELLPVIECLSRRPADSFQTVSELYASLHHGTAAVLSTQAVSALRTVFLDAVDRRLQDLYRRYFAVHPPPRDAIHDRKVAALQAVRTQAQDIVGSYDWPWLADWLELDRIGENAEACVRRLSNLALDVRAVNFRFTYHCNIACRHCYNGSGPHMKAQRIPLEPMLAIIAQMPSVGIGRLNLTGGEPFLYPDHVAALIAAGRAAGLRGISIYTNGYWAATDEQSKQTLDWLSAAGFMKGSDDFLKISSGIYHQEFVAFDRALTLARRYHAMFGRPLIVDFELAPGQSGLAEEIRGQVSAAGLTEQIQLHFRKVWPLGRGKELEGIAIQRIEMACDAIKQIVFDPDGAVRPCCGLNNENHGVVIGSLNSCRLTDLVKRMQNDPILQFLATHPMSAIFEYLDKPERADGYSGYCHLCQDAIGHLSDKEPLQARLFDQQKFYPFWFSLSGSDGTVRFAADAEPDGLD
jgi:pyruvate-formate lyase-activating enzyme